MINVRHGELCGVVATTSPCLHLSRGRGGCIDSGPVGGGWRARRPGLRGNGRSKLCLQCGHVAGLGNQPHARPVQQIGLGDGDVGCGRLHQERQTVLECGVQRGEPGGQESPLLRADESTLRPGSAFGVVPARPEPLVSGKGELRGVARDGEGVHAGLPGQREAEGDAVVVGAGHHGEGAAAVAQGQGEFVEVIAHVAVLAEVVLPVRVD